MNSKMVIDYTGSKSIFEFAPLPVDDPVKRKPNIDLAIENLHWQPQISIEEGLKRTISYFQNIR